MYYLCRIVLFDNSTFQQFQCCGSKNGTSDWSMASTFQNQSQVIIETNNLTATSKNNDLKYFSKEMTSLL